MDGLRIRGFRHRRVLPDDRGLACIPIVAERSSVGRPGEQALHDRPFRDGLIHHSDRGVQYLSIRYTERLAEAGIMPSLGSVGDSCDNALVETIIGLYKTELIYHEGPWKGIDHVEYQTFEWVDWFNMVRLLEPIGDIPPIEFENLYYQRQTEEPAMVVGNP